MDNFKEYIALFWDKITLFIPDKKFLEISMEHWAILIICFILSLLLRGMVDRLIHLFIRKLPFNVKDKTQNRFVDALSEPLSYIFVVGGIYIPSHIIKFPKNVENFIDSTGKMILTIIVFWSIFRLITSFESTIKRLIGKMSAHMSDDIANILLRILRITVAFIGFVVVLDFWNVNITAFLGGLGILGMAFAFASQESIKNIFGSVTILLDNIYKNGDWIKTPKVEGIVENVGLRTTALRQFDKCLVTIPNGVMANEPIINFSRMNYRRIVWRVGLSYNSTTKQLESIRDRFRTFLEESPDIETNPSKVTTLVRIDAFGDSALELFCYFFTKTTAWAPHMEVKETCLLKLRQIIEEEGSSIAYPTRSVIHENPR